MESILIITARLIAITLDVISLAMILRMLLPMFVDAEGNKLYFFCAVITEPFVIPVRLLLVKFNILQDSPIDWSFTLSYMLLMLIRLFLPAI